MADKYYRLVCLLINVCSEPLRDFFLKLARSDSVKPFVDLQTYLLHRQTDITRMASKNIIRTDQYELIFPSVGTPDIKNWDVTLVITLTRKLFKLQKLHELILDEIREIRNALQHVPKTSNISDTDFSDLWDRLALASKSLAYHIAGHTYETEINKKIQDTLSNNMPNLGDTLKSFYEEDRKEMLHQLSTIKETMEEDRIEMTREIQSLKAHIYDLKCNTDNIAEKSEVSTSLLRSVTITDIGKAGEQVKRLKTVDHILDRLKANFKRTMSILSDDYIPTKGVDKIRNNLRDHRHVVVSGCTNSHYLKAALEAIRALGYNFDRCVEMEDESDWRHINPDDVDLVLCQDPFGRLDYDSTKAISMLRIFDRMLHVVKSKGKNLDLVIVTSLESLTKVEKSHELLSITVKLFDPTSNENPEDLTGPPVRPLSCYNISGRHFSRNYTDLHLDQLLRISVNLDLQILGSAKTKLKSNKTLLVSGPPKSGKTTLAFTLAQSYKREEVLMLCSPGDVKHVDFNTTSLVIIDDFGGRYRFNIDEVNKWFSRLDLLLKAAEAGKLNVIIISESERLKCCIREIGQHPLLSDPVVLSGCFINIKQETAVVLEKGRLDLEGHTTKSIRSAVGKSRQSGSIPDDRTVKSKPEKPRLLVKIKPWKTD